MQVAACNPQCNSGDPKTYTNMTTDIAKYNLLRSEMNTAPGELTELPKTPVKHDQTKTNWNLLPWDAVEEVVKVLEFGASKYSPHNWKDGGGFKWTRVFNSTMRHLTSWYRGEDRDPETGLSHLAHCCCNILFLLHYSLNKPKFDKDDRI